MEIRPILSTLARHKTAAALIVLEIALTCAIISNALFMIGDRLSQIRESSGIAENELVRIQITAIGNDPDAVARTRTDLATLHALPGVKDATIVNQVPFVNMSWNSGVNVTPEQEQPTLHATQYMAEEHFLGTFGVRLVAGRNFNADEYLDYDVVQQSGGASAVPSVIITRKMAEKLFPGVSPAKLIGKPIYTDGMAPTRIVGVLDHLVRPGMQGGPSAREYTMVPPIRTHYNVGGNYVIRTEPGRRADVLKAAVAALRAQGNDRIILDENSKSFEDLRNAFYQAPRSMAWLLGAVCVGLLLITALGIVGLASFWVQQRTKQIGIRRALGATRGQILCYFQIENFLIASIGIAIGMLLAFALNQLLMSKYELPRLPLYYLPIGALVLWLLGQIAVLGPARRAAAVPPAIATRSA